jgi:hypothetical protein
VNHRPIRSPNAGDVDAALKTLSSDGRIAWGTLESALSARGEASTSADVAAALNALLAVAPPAHETSTSSSDVSASADDSAAGRALLARQLARCVALYAPAADPLPPALAVASTHVEGQKRIAAGSRAPLPLVPAAPIDPEDVLDAADLAGILAV